MIVTPEHHRSVIGALSRVIRKRPVRWGLGALVLVNTLLLAVLVLTEQFHWLPSPWSPNATKILLQAFLVTSVINTILFGLTGIASAVYLYRRRATNERADLMTLLRRALIVPAIYVLSILWGWSWLAGRSPRLFGMMLVAVWSGSQVIHFVYFTVRAFRQARVARGSAFRTIEPARFTAPTLQSILKTRAQKIRRASGRRWWSLTHRDYIKRLPAPDRALFESVVHGVTQNVEVFLKRGADPNLRLIYGMPLIAFCASLGRNEAVRVLLDAGADINAGTPSLGFNALLSAADKGNLALVRLLIGHGADIEARISSGATPLMLAARNGHADVVALLLENGARKDTANAKGVTALIFASIYGHPGAAETLLDAGADPSVKTAIGRTALDYAKKKGHKELVKTLSQGLDREKCSEVIL